MCGRYIQVQSVEVIEKRYNVKAQSGIELKPNYNISPGQYAPVITNDNPKEIQMFQFGMTPFWAKKPMYLLNARSEGDRNKENDTQYKGAKEIILKPSFRKPIRSQRCLVIADAFIEGTTAERLNKPFVVYLKNHERPFSFAGIWDSWTNTTTGEVVNSFSIITTVSNSLIQKIPHHRSPVILPRQYENYWIDSNRPLTDITKLLKPFPGEAMNAYPISSAIKSPKSEGRELIDPIGEPLSDDKEFKLNEKLILQGMGRHKKNF